MSENVRIGKAMKSPMENRIAFHFTFGELAKASVLDLLVLLYQDKRKKKEFRPPNCAEHNLVLLTKNRRGAK
jgi:hypothetical protein